MIMYLQLIGAMQLIIIISDARYTLFTNVHDFVHVYHQYIQNYIKYKKIPYSRAVYIPSKNTPIA